MDGYSHHMCILYVHMRVSAIYVQTYMYTRMYVYM